MRYLFLILSCVVFLFGESVTITPKGSVVAIGASFDKDYISLGKTINQQNGTQYFDYVIGGTPALELSNDTTRLYMSLYFSHRIGNKSENSLENESTWYDENQNNLHYLGEAYVQHNYQNHTIKLGRVTKKSQLVDSNERITKNSFEGLQYQYKDKNLDIDILYFNRIASSTLSNSVPYNHNYGFLGYGMGYEIGNFIDISKHILNEEHTSFGVIHSEIQYNKENYKVEFENLYADNFFQTTSLNLGINSENFFAKVGGIYQTSTGDDYIEKKFGKKLQSNLYQGEIQYQKEKFNIVYRISKTLANSDAILSGTLFSPFSNKPAWIKGLNTAHAFIADTNSQQLLFYNTFYPSNLPVVTLIASYNKYDIGKNNGDTTFGTPIPLDVRERFIVARGHLSKNLTVQLQYSKVKNPDRIISETKNSRMIVGYKF